MSGFGANLRLGWLGAAPAHLGSDHVGLLGVSAVIRVAQHEVRQGANSARSSSAMRRTSVNGHPDLDGKCWLHAAAADDQDLGCSWGEVIADDTQLLGLTSGA